MAVAMPHSSTSLAWLHLSPRFSRILAAQWTRNYYYFHKRDGGLPRRTGIIILISPRYYSFYSIVPLRPRPHLLNPPLCPLFQPRPPSSPRPSPVMTGTVGVTNASCGSTPESSLKTVRVVIKGRVQGVFYRNWTMENATRLGLKGWVRNRRDGSVEALFSGDADKVQQMEQMCRRGPPDAIVTGLQVFPSDDDPGTQFELKQTV